MKILCIGIPLVLSTLLLPSSLPAAPEKAKAPSRARASGSAVDPYLWLEKVEDKKALAWVVKQNNKSRDALAKSDEFKTMKAQFLEILDSDARIPYVEKIGHKFYNFWKDREHVRGVWRRTSMNEYRTEHPTWEIVLDLDSLSKAEGVEWVWGGAETLPPDYQRCLVMISRGGSDADIVREFDLTSKSFVTGGFSLPEAKSHVAWRNRDAVYVGTDFGAGSMTSSGYPRIVKEWKRGTPLASAATIYEGEHGDVSTSGFHYFTPGFERDVIWRSPTFFSRDMRVRRGADWVKLEKPDDAYADFFREWLLLRLRSDWKIGEKTWPSGALLAIPIDDFLSGKRQFDLLFEPSSRRSLEDWTSTRNAIFLSTLDNVNSKLFALRRESGRWATESLPGVTEFGSNSIESVDPYESDEYFLKTTGFLTPPSLYFGRVGGGPPELLKHAPSFYDTTGLEVTQHEATSKDGTIIPYFQVSRRGLNPNGATPTLMMGYGGFEISSVPYYSGTLGQGWLAKGGVFVLANIRGGGEFGPAWHEAAVKANRHHTYEDFIAVAEHLIGRKVTSPRHLGAIGGSNGGLLVGNMVTLRPDLWGAIVCAAPLLDMRRYHKLLAGASWIAEYGNPDDPKEWSFMRDYSPYQNLKKGVKYPPILFTTSTRDDRVHPGHARKMAAKMIAMGSDVQYYENVEGGHAGSSTHEQQAYMSSLSYTFLWKHLR